MLSHLKEMTDDAIKRKYALGAYNIHNFETCLGVVRAAVEGNSPAIIQVSEGTIKYMGLKPVTHIVSTMAKNLAVNVPIALHLDHGKSLDSIIGCIKAGFSSVHIDASHLPLDENIALTKEAVKIGHDHGVLVQGEVGAIVGGHGAIGGHIDIPKADPDEVVRFVEETGVDTIAAAIGTAHGVFENEEIDFNLLEYIKKRVGIPFVLHGASGITDDMIRRGIKEGVNIINIGTDIKVAFTQTLIKTCLAHQDESDPRNLLNPCIDMVKAVVLDKMKLFGSVDKGGENMIET